MVSIQITEQPLDIALKRFEEQTGLQIDVAADAVRGKNTRPVEGTIQPEAALRALLAGSGLVPVGQAGGFILQAANGGLSSDQKLAEVVVTASSNPVSRYVGTSSNAAARLPADPMDLPVAGMSIPRAVIEDHGVLRPAEAVRNVSGVTRNPAYLGLTDTYRIRGFPADIGLWNGCRRNFYYSSTDVAHLERIEVIKGAASVTYGDLEPGGVVNYVTRRPSRKPVNTVGLTAGSYGLIGPEFDAGWAGGEDGAVRMRVSGAYETADSFRNFVENRHSTLGATLDWDIQPGTRLELSAYTVNSEIVPDRGFFNSIGPLVLSLPRERFLGEPDDRYTFRQKDMSALLSHRLSTQWSVRGGVNLYQVDDERDNFQFRNLQPDGRTIRRQYTFVPNEDEYTTVFGEVRGDLKLGNLEHTFVAGVERIDRKNQYDFRWDRSSGYLLDLFDPVYGQAARPLLPRSRTRVDTTLNSAYFQNLVKIGERWRMLAGLRHSRYRQSDTQLDDGTRDGFTESETTSRLGLLYRLTVEDSVFASYGESFSPQVFSYASLSPGLSPDPEQGRQFEFGYKHTSVDERLVAGFTAFRIEKRNVATSNPDDATLNVLSGEQTVRGVEFDASARLGAGWSIIGSCAWLKADVSRDTALPVGDALVNTPKHQASLWVRHDFTALPGVGVGIGAFHVGRREAELPNTWTIPGYTRHDASAYWKVNPSTDLALHVKNVSDKRYHDSQGNLLYPGAPRSALVSVRNRF